MNPSIIPGVVIAVLVLALCLVVLVMLGLDRGDPAETAVAYELAWDRLDFALLWTLSASELRDGRDQEGFVAAKEQAYRSREGLAGLVARVTVERIDRVGKRARAVTRLELHDGGVFRHELRMRRQSWRWAVESYRTGPDDRRAVREASGGA